MSEEEIYKMLLTEKLDKFPLLNELFAIRNSKFKINDYTIYVTGCISLDVINKAIEKVNLISNLQTEIIALNMTHKYDTNMIEAVKGEAVELYNEIERLQKELDKKDKRLSRQFKLLSKKDKEIEELKKDNSHQWEERCKLTFELDKKDKVIDLMAEKLVEDSDIFNYQHSMTEEKWKQYFYKEVEKENE